MATHTNTQKRPELRRISDSQLEVADRGQDVRGREVLDVAGEKIGKVSDLYVDEREKQVRFLEVASGGFLGIGQDRILVPVEALRSVTRDAVHVGRARESLSDAPLYDPQLVNEDFLNRTYDYYGLAPYWHAGYVYPARWHL